MGAPDDHRDIIADFIRGLDWSPQGVMGSLGKTADHACEYAAVSARWYLRNKKWKRSWARCLRFLAILFVAAAGVLLMVQQLLADAKGTTMIAPVWASILLAVSVFLVALDRFFGFSPGWIRYIQAEAQIRRFRQEFEFDWQILLASFAGKAPSIEQVQHAIASAKALVTRVNAVIGDETARWAADFQEAVRQVDVQVHSVPVAQRSTNGKHDVALRQGRQPASKK